MEWKGILSNWIVKNLLLAIVIVLALIIGVQIFLSLYTHHGDKISVPDLVSLSLEDAAKAAVAVNMRTDVVDSLFVRNMPRGAVVRQDPSAGTMVKEGRRIQLIINAVTPKQIPMPNLVGYSLRSASTELAARGLKLGRQIYVKDIATNNVLNQIYNNVEIKPGTMIPSDSTIDLVLGLNPDDE